MQRIPDQNQSSDVSRGRTIGERKEKNVLEVTSMKDYAENILCIDYT